ncbi:hypothetical protein F5883DRAFT_433052 [Diaporthe sp. PMI_573]|nr:hypothetical protein F5883DRAFT_433052 [Diaporthaceae sp. PMI_573]
MDIDTDQENQLDQEHAENQSDRSDDTQKKGDEGQEKSDDTKGKGAGEEEKSDSNDKKKVTIGSEELLPSIEGDNLFVLESEDADKSDSAAAVVDPEYGRPLFSRPAPGSIKDAETVAWAKPRGGVLYINRYGKKSAGIYRLSSLAQSAGYKTADEQPASGGDKKLDIRAIFGVAWKSQNFGEHAEDDLDLINPAVVRSFRENPTYVLIQYDGDGEMKKAWVTRTTVRASWGNKNADAVIYKAAVEAEERYMEAKTGKRQAISRSPSVGLAQGYVDRQRDKSVGSSRSSFSRSPTPGSRISKSPTPNVSDPIGPAELQDLRVKFLGDYLELLNLGDFSALSARQRADCTDAWNAKKAMYVEATA